MAQQLRVLAALLEDPGSDPPAPMMRGSKLPVTPSPWGSNSLLWSLWEHTHVLYMCTGAYARTHAKYIAYKIMGFVVMFFSYMCIIVLCL